MGITAEQLQAALPALQPALMDMIRRHVDNPHAAQDILQDTIVAACRGVDSLRDPALLLAWLRGIARNRIRHYYSRERKKHRWNDMSEEAAANRPPRDLLHSIEAILGRLIAVEPEPDALLPLTLHFAMGWTAAEIARYFALKPNTVYRRIERVARRLRDAGAGVDPDPRLTLLLKIKVLVRMFSMATVPSSGPAYRSLAMIRDIHGAVQSLYEAHADEDDALQLMCEMSFARGQMQEYDNDMVPYRYPYEFDREKWNWGCIAAGERCYHRLMRRDFTPDFRARMEYHWRFSAARTLTQADWDRLRALAERCVRADPRAVMWHLNVAVSLHELEGAKTALRYLEKHRTNKALAEFSRYYHVIGKFAMEIGAWNKARSAWKTSLRWPTNDAFRGEIQRHIADCAAKDK